VNKLAEKLSVWFGSTPFILSHVVFFAAWFPLGGKTDTLTVIVSLEAIFLSLFILRSENVQSARMEKNVKKDIRTSKKILKEIEELGYKS